MPAILTLNAGSSSLKFSLFTHDGDLDLASHGQVDAIPAEPHFVAKTPDGATLEDRKLEGDYHAIVAAVLDWIDAHLGADALEAAGHRVVHGGPDHVRPERVTDVLLAALDRLVPLAPLHLPHNLELIRAVAAARPTLPQVACFDTGFHATMPALATRFALPRDLHESGIRRYGFHGLSYEFIARTLRRIDPALASGRVIVAHLGNGASLCALHDGRSVDTTMGLTALDGLMMGTRCGALDPGVVLYLEQERGLSPDDVQHLLYDRSGLLGVSGIASDMRTLRASPAPAAHEAIDLFGYRIARETGALASSLAGLDGFVFTAGIGEHDAALRAEVCARLSWLGLALDPAANEAHAPIISAPSSRVRIRVLPTDEERMIALHSLETLR